MLYYIDIENNILLHPDALKLCEELRVLDEKEVKCIVYAYDYSGPYKQFAEQDRKRKALIKVYGSDENDLFEKDKIKHAVSAYISLQYNPKIELISTYNLNINTLQQKLIDEDDDKVIARILKSIDLLRKSIRELEMEVYEDTVKEGRIVGGAGLSFLEGFQKRQAAYKNIMPKKVKPKPEPLK